MESITPREWTARMTEGIFSIHNRFQPGRPNLVMLHGALGNIERLGPLILAFQEQVNLVLFDLRGHGKSKLATGGYDIETMARDLHVPLRALFRDVPLIVFGESFSGLIGLELAASFPNLVTVVLADTPFDMSRVNRSHIALRNVHKRHADRSAAIAAFSRGIFGYDPTTGGVRALAFHRFADRCPARMVMITGDRKEREQPDRPEMGAYFDDVELAKLEPATRERLEVRTIAGGGHRLIPTHPADLISILCQIMNLHGAASVDAPRARQAAGVS